MEWIGNAAVACKVLSFIDTRELLSTIALVNHNLYEAVQTTVSCCISYNGRTTSSSAKSDIEIPSILQRIERILARAQLDDTHLFSSPLYLLTASKLTELYLSSIQNLNDISANELLTSCPSSLQSLSIHNAPDLKTLLLPTHLYNLARLAIDSCKLLHSIKLKNDGFEVSSSSSASSLGFPKLQTLQLSFCASLSNTSLQLLLVAIPPGVLHSLSVVRCHALTTSVFDCVSDTPDYFSNLTSLEIANCNNLSSFERNPFYGTNLTSLKLLGSKNLEQFLTHQKWTNLQSLDFSLSKIADSIIESFAAANPNLLSVSAWNCGHLTASSLLSVLTHNTHIESLVFSWSSDLQLQKADLSILRPFLSLNKLLLSRCLSLTEPGLCLLLENCPNLMHLDISDCPLLGDKCLETVATANCGYLRQFSMHNCPLVTDEGAIKFLRSECTCRVQGLSFGRTACSIDTLHVLEHENRTPMMEALDISLGNLTTQLRSEATTHSHSQGVHSLLMKLVQSNNMPHLQLLTLKGIYSVPAAALKNGQRPALASDPDWVAPVMQQRGELEAAVACRSPALTIIL